MRTPFNPNRLVTLPLHGTHQQFNVIDLMPLTDALEQNLLSPTTPVLHTQRGGTTLVFQTRHFSLYNVMQGGADDELWMATFCAICNGGASFSPIYEGVRYDFYGAGFYDAMTLLADKQTGSYWDHITGECIAGPMQGAQLRHLANLTHTQADVVTRTHPDAMIAVTAPDPTRAAMNEFAEGLRTQMRPDWLPVLHDSIDSAQEDMRLPRLEMGLGVWTEKSARFYRFQTIAAADNMIFDSIDGQCVLIYIDPITFTPAALYTDARAGTWNGDALDLDNGQRVRDGELIDRGQTQPTRRPLQLFQRWYGFSITFPNCSIYRTAR